MILYPCVASADVDFFSETSVSDVPWPLSGRRFRGRTKKTVLRIDVPTMVLFGGKYLFAFGKGTGCCVPPASIDGCIGLTSRWWSRRLFSHRGKGLATYALQLSVSE